MLLKPLKQNQKKVGETIPITTFIYRMLGDDMQFYDVNDTDANHDIQWVKKPIQDLAQGRIVIFSAPGAFSNVSSNWQIPSYEGDYDKMKDLGVDEVYVISVNDSSTMRNWLKDLGVSKVKYLPDGNGNFTRRMGMLVDRSTWGSGFCSWRYAMVVEDGVIKYYAEEWGIDTVETFGNTEDGWKHDPYVETNPHKVIDFLKGL